ncbi:hypothetical protein FJTKL_10491 [Diaporthe vaccinii]|uniref:RRM domain-containing protein n=1 Tax=Diaporthe vaccinii TaxID=105482 RepID=A0ABR4EJM3_9PEZI
MPASIDTQLVTIDRAYFDTLVRRANFNREDILKSSDVSISKSEHDGLKQIAAKYANLRQNLERGGVDGATIDLLSKDDATLGQQAAASTPSTAESNIDTTASYAPQSPCSRVLAPRRVFNGSGSHEYKEQHKTPAHVDSGVDENAGDDDYSVSGGRPVGSFQTQAYNGHAPMRPHYERQCARSILLSKLPDNTTHADITDAVRGGQLLDIYLRSNDRTAAVSFLLAADARAFYDHVKRHDLYINHKRVEIRWNDRQFILPGHVASKVGIGATRNLVIRRCDPRLTESVQSLLLSASTSFSVF